MAMSWISTFALALGVFFGNWIVVPLLFGKRRFKDGFFIGFIAMLLVIILKAIFF